MARTLEFFLVLVYHKVSILDGGEHLHEGIVNSGY